MAEYWNSLPLLSQVFMLLAAPATLILAIQTVLLFFGHGGGGADMDSDVSGLDSGGMDIHDGAMEFHDHMDHAGGAEFDAAGLRLFSIRGIFAFFAVGGWTGLLCSESGVPAPLSILIAFMLGAASLYGLAKLMQAMMKLQESGTIDYRHGLGKQAQVYLTIPAKGRGKGKINLELSGSLGEFSAVTESEDPIPTGSMVRVVDIIGDVFVVEVV